MPRTYKPVPPRKVIIDSKGMKLKNGKYIDFKILEDLYANGGNHMHAARAFGLSEQFYSELRNHGDEVQGVDLSEFREAIKRGQHRIADRVLQSLLKHSDKSFVPAIFLAKQPHILGFSDNHQQVSGEIKITVQEQILAPAKKLGSPNVVDAEYTDITEEK